MACEPVQARLKCASEGRCVTGSGTSKPGRRIEFQSDIAAWIAARGARPGNVQVIYGREKLKGENLRRSAEVVLPQAPAVAFATLAYARTVSLLPQTPAVASATLAYAPSGRDGRSALPFSLARKRFLSASSAGGRLRDLGLRAKGRDGRNATSPLRNRQVSSCRRRRPPRGRRCAYRRTSRDRARS